MSITNQKSVLIVDDSPEQLMLLQKILANVGVNTLQAQSVTQAKGMLEAFTPHAIITDLMMEPDSGFDLLNQLRANKQLASVPVIVLSAKRDKSAVHEALGLGARDYVLKPLDAKVLLQKLKKHLNSGGFSSLNYSPEQAPQVEVLVPATIIAGADESLKIETTVRLAKECSVMLSSPQLEAMGLARPPIMRTSGAPPRMNDRAAFENELRFLGLTDTQVEALREIIRRWHS